MKKIIASLAFAAIGSTAVAAPELIVNGGFENLSIQFFNPGYLTIGNGSNVYAPWVIGGISVDAIHGAYGAITGRSIDLLGSPGPGSVAQTFATVANQSYLLSFDLSANNNGLDDGHMTLTIDNTTYPTFLGAVNVVNNHTLSFIAQTNSTTLTFASALVSKNGGPILDNVSVTAVPEPESYAMFLAGLGVMGAIAVRRQKSKNGA